VVNPIYLIETLFIWQPSARKELVGKESAKLRICVYVRTEALSAHVLGRIPKVGCLSVTVILLALA